MADPLGIITPETPATETPQTSVVETPATETPPQVGADSVKADQPATTDAKPVELPPDVVAQIAKLKEDVKFYQTRDQNRTAKEQVEKAQKVLAERGLAQPTPDGEEELPTTAKTREIFRQCATELQQENQTVEEITKTDSQLREFAKQMELSDEEYEMCADLVHRARLTPKEIDDGERPTTVEENALLVKALVFLRSGGMATEKIKKASYDKGYQTGLRAQASTTVPGLTAVPPDKRLSAVDQAKLKFIESVRNTSVGVDPLS